MFGECCFDAGDVKITMGTGTFMDINTGNKPHTSLSGTHTRTRSTRFQPPQCNLVYTGVCVCLGLYPLVGWKIGSDVVYLAEGNAADTGTSIRWAQEIGEHRNPFQECVLNHGITTEGSVTKPRHTTVTFHGDQI